MAQIAMSGATPTNPFATMPDPFAAPAPAGAAPAGAAPRNPFATMPDPFAAPAPVTPQSNASLPSDVGRAVGDVGIGMAQDVVGFGQLLTAPGDGFPSPVSRGMTPAMRTQADAGNATINPTVEKYVQPINTWLAKQQMPLAAAQQYNQSLMTPTGKAILNAPLNPAAPGNVFTYPIGQVAAIRGAQIGANLLSFLLPGSVLGKAVKFMRLARTAAGATSAAMATTMGATGAGQTMAAVSQAVNNTSDAMLRQQVPAYAQYRKQGMSVDDAKARLIDAQGDAVSAMNGLVSAAVGELTGARLGAVLKNNPMAGNVIKRIAVEGTTQGVAGGVMGGASSAAQQVGIAPENKKPFSWGALAAQAGEGALAGTTLGALFGIAQKHAPEVLTPEEHVAAPHPDATETAEGLAVNHALHPEPESEPIDYDQQHGEEDEEPTQAQPQNPAPAVDEATRQAVAAATSAPETERTAASEVPPASTRSADITAPVPKEPGPAPLAQPVPKKPEPTPLAGPKPYVSPESNEDRMPVASAAKVGNAARKLLGPQSNVAKLVTRDVGTSDTGLVSRIMADLLKQAHDELPYHGGDVDEMLRQFAATKPLPQRIAEAVDAARQARAQALDQPDAPPEAFGPAAVDPNEQPTQTRVRAGDAYEPGNEGLLLSKINPDEDNRTTYARAKKMVARRGDDAHSVYQDILDMRDRRGGDVRTRQLLMNRAKAAEKNYLRAEAARTQSQRPPLEHELLQHEPPPLGPESDQAFWARVERAHSRGEDAGSFIKRGTFLYRARKLLDDARADGVRDAIPNRKLTNEMRGEEFIARHANTNPLANNSKTIQQEIAEQELAEQERLNKAGLGLPDMLKREDGAAPLSVKSAQERAGTLKIKRGADAMTGRLRLAQGLDKQSSIHSDDIREVEDFLHFLGPHLTKDTGLSVRNGPPNVWGSFTPRTRVVHIYKSAIAKGELTRTAIHELWHSVETALTLRDKFALRKEHVTQMNKFLAKNPWMKAFVERGEYPKMNLRSLKDTLTGTPAKEFIAKYGNDPHIMDQVKLGDNGSVSWLPTHASYRFKNWNEYFAETMTDRHFAERDLEDARARSIIGHLHTFVQRIKDRIARVFGSEASGRIYEGFRQQQFSHRQEALDAYGEEQFSKVFKNKPKDIIQSVESSSYDPVANKLRDMFFSNTSAMNAIRAGFGKLANGQDLAEAGKNIFDWTPNTRIATESTEGPSHTFQNALNHTGSYALKIADAFAPIQHRMAWLLSKAKPDDAATFQELMAHSTHYNYDPTKAPGPRSKATSTHGIQRKAQHGVGYAMMKKLPPELQKLFKDTRDAVHDARVAVAREAVRSTVAQAHLAKAREAIGGSKLVPGNTTLRLNHAEIDAQTDRYMNKQETDDDKSFMGAETHKLLAKERGSPHEFENYFPARRYGKQAVQYRDLRPEEHTFSSEADMEHFAKTTDLYIKGSSRKDFDANGDEVDKNDPAAKPVVRSEFTARTQNEGLEFFDKPHQAKSRVEELRNHPTNKYWVPDAEHTRESTKVGGALSPAALSVLRHALGKASEDGASKPAIEHALNEAVIQLLPPNSVRYGALRRRNVMGASQDTLQVLHDYFLGTANTMARLRFGHEAFNALEAMREYTETHTAGPDGMNHVRQELVKLAEQRSQAAPMDTPSNGAINQTIRGVQQYTFVNDMSNAAFNMVQLAQPWMTGMPYLAARYGKRATVAEMGRNIARLGFGLYAAKEGAMQMYGGAHNALSKDVRAPKDYVQIYKDMLTDGAKTLADKARAAEHISLIERLAADNAIGHNGAGLQVRASLDAAGKGWFMRALHAAEEVTRAMPTAIEVANRLMLGTSAYELEKAKSGGKEQAYIAARTAIKETQADYSPPNTALLMQGSKHPFLQPFFTFKKYAQMVYSLIGRHTFEAFAGENKEVRRVARNTVLNTLATHVAVTGMHGLPIGAALTMLSIASLVFGDHRAFNYDQWLHETGQKLGLNAKEIDLFANGLTTLIGFNAVGRMGLSSLVLDQAPPENTVSSWTQWLGNTMIGAPGQMLGSTVEAIQAARHGDFKRAAELVMPAVISNKIKAISEAEHGLQDTEGNQMVPPLPWNQVLAQWMGWEPDAVEEAYGAREAGTTAKHEYQESRAATLDSFKRAYAGGNFGAASQALAQFNTTVPYSSRLTFSQALRATRPGNKNNQQIDGVGFTKKQQFLAAPMAAYNLPTN